MANDSIAAEKAAFRGLSPEEQLGRTRGRGIGVAKELWAAYQGKFDSGKSVRRPLTITPNTITQHVLTDMTFSSSLRGVDEFKQVITVLTRYSPFDRQRGPTNEEALVKLLMTAAETQFDEHQSQFYAAAYCELERLISSEADQFANIAGTVQVTHDAATTARRPAGSIEPFGPREAVKIAAPTATPEASPE